MILRAGGYTHVPAKELNADRVITDFLELPEAIRGVSAVDAGATGEGAESTGRNATMRENRARAVAEQLTG